MTIWNNDEARSFFIANGYPTQYNDGLKLYLEDILSLQGQGLAFNDLLYRYIKLYGIEFTSLVSNFLLLEDGSKLLQEDSTAILIEN
jgi:hypothetical protein